jgi:hypothetical protein
VVLKGLRAQMRGPLGMGEIVGREEHCDKRRSLSPPFPGGPRTWRVDGSDFLGKLEGPTWLVGR